MFVYYNQILNALEQFDVFLIPLRSTQYNESLSPAFYNNMIIMDQCYQTMATKLYQKVLNPDVIPMEYT
jgi:hypothetical protein